MPILALVPHGVAPLAAFAGLCAAGLLVQSGSWRVPALLAPAAMLGLLLVWGVASAIWAIDPARSLILDLRLAGLFLAGLALAAAAERIAAPGRMALCLIAGGALGLVLAGYDLATAGGLTQHISVRGFRPVRLDQIAIGLAILGLPASALLFARRPIAGLAALIVAAGAVFLLEDASAKAALVAAVPVAAIALWRPRVVARVAALLSVLFILTVPMTMPKLAVVPGLVGAADSFKISAGHRLLVWCFVGERISERPLLGWGLDSSRAIPGGNAEARPGQNWLPLHPHNAPLQVWLELGAPGAVLFAALVALFWLRLDRLGAPRLYAAAAAGALVAALGPEFAAYGVWQEWWIGTLALALFLVLVMARAAQQQKPASLPGLTRQSRGSAGQARG
jgi:O-antigen ligase